MWLPSKAFELFQVSKDGVDSLREELASLRTERDLLKAQLLTAQTNFSWITTRVNALEVERAALLEKATGIKTVVPEIVQTPRGGKSVAEFSFEDVGDEMAKALGLPSYSN